MRKNYFLLLVLALSFTTSFAQQKRFSFQGAAQVGLLEGEMGSAFQFGAMGGIKKNTWIASVGTGLDYYRVRSIPLYLNLQKNLFNKDNTPFVYLGAGYHFLWLPEVFSEWSWPSALKTKGGVYYHGGIGYQVPAFKKTSLFFATAFSGKEYHEEYLQTNPCLIGPCPQTAVKTSYHLRRLSVTTGLRF
jgi:hypothetical protein